MNAVLKSGLPLITNVLKPLAKINLIPLGSTAASATLWKIYASDMTALITSKKEIEDDMKIVKYLEKPALSIKGDGQNKLKINQKKKKVDLLAFYQALQEEVIQVRTISNSSKSRTRYD